jgi:hypothetical protein
MQQAVQSTQRESAASPYARVVEVSKRIRWEIDRDVIRGRTFGTNRKYLPDGLSKVAELPFLSAGEKRFFSQVQGRTYANVFALVERFISAKFLEVSRGHWLGDQGALEALVRSADEEIKHQAMFRKLEAIAEEEMPDGYAFLPQPNDVAAAVLAKSTWAVLALTCHIELFVLAHYRSSIGPDGDLSELWKDVFLFHWKEESQHAILDELEWRREDARLSAAERDQAVNDLIELVAAVDGILQVQSVADAGYFQSACGRAFTTDEAEAIRATFLAAYRWQYIGSGVQEPRFQEILGGLITAEQGERIGAALAPIVN